MEDWIALIIGILICAGGNMQYEKRTGSYPPSWPLCRRPLQGYFRFRRKLPSDLKLFGGSAYWCLSRDCIEYMNNFVQQNAALVNFYKHVKIPEEIFFQTVLLNSPLKNQLVNDDLRYIVWSGTRHPAILHKEDLKEFINTNKLFARKFDVTIDPDVLDMIDEATS